MVLISLLLSTMLLIVANVIAHKTGKLVAPCCIAGLGVVLGWPCLLFPALVLCGMLMVVAALVAMPFERGPRHFLIGSLAALVGSHVLVGAFSWSEIRERMQLRARYPTESLEVRLAYETRRTESLGQRSRALASANRSARAAASPVDKELEDLENQLDGVAGVDLRRTIALMRLHEQAVEDFIDSPGFGVSRRLEPRKEYIDLPEAASIPLPAAPREPEGTDRAPQAPGPSSSLADAIERPPTGNGFPPAPPEDFRAMHQDSVLDFVNPKGFGYVKDRQHVKGFQAHQFHAMPSSTSSRWHVQRLELVSLLKHDEPVVYLSEHLPRMDELRDARTRPLDSFEKSALADLQAGENLKMECTRNRLRMLGAVRAARQCLSCHAAERGELLGCFSYTLRREPANP